MLECCFWNVELRIIVEKHPAYAILEVLNLMHGPVHPAVAAQPDGVSLLEHPLRCLEQQPACVDVQPHRVTEGREASLAPVFPTVWSFGCCDEVARGLVRDEAVIVPPLCGGTVPSRVGPLALQSHAVPSEHPVPYRV